MEKADKDYTLEDLKAMVKGPTGLVVMRIKRSFAPYFVNDIAGFPPENAFLHIQEGNAILERKGAKEAPAPEPVAKKDSGKAPGVSTDDFPDPNVVPIPEDWETKHHLQIMTLSQKISKEPAPEGTKPLDHAKAIIRAEVERRANPKT